MLLSEKDRSGWNELDDNLIYFKNSSGFFKFSHLRIKNIKTDKMMDCLNIVPTTLGVLNKENSYLIVFIETKQQKIIARLDKISLNLKINYRICYQYIFNPAPMYNLNNQLLLMFENGRLVQMFKNKIIRKDKGKLEQILGHNVLLKMRLMSFNLLIYEEKLFYSSQFQLIFEQQFNIQLRDIEEQYGRHIFKKLGSFLVLSKQQKYSFKYEQVPVYYLSIDFILKGNGIKGKILLNNDEKLKMIKCFSNILYVLKTIREQFKVYEINGQNEREFVYSIDSEQRLKKPILYQKHLIFTNTWSRFVPIQYEIESQSNKKDIK